ncbi:hypothetical protein BD324DRAFT_615532 [Kockovaella imperatae]|uniref:Zn(2)-C6 fungal-type domain-containing protein n=1 Tax=Kockovaella imperatae TaxID=4999 RepID=A0A1Y1UPI8_9TREE|nr:hypothetical protein BD324DRAFT_615532 [Kockovaella imperatae]ORX39919.1 hypothetical protein BD324DRAFT_615532 [Kockovaella imperatae]
MDASYPPLETPGVSVSKSSPNSSSSPPVLVFSPAYTMPQANWYGYPSSTPGSYGYSHPMTPYTHMENLTPYTTYATTPAPVGGHALPLTATPTTERAYNTASLHAAAPSVLFGQPHSLYGSPASSISSALPLDKETTPPLLLPRRASESTTMDYYLPTPGLLPVGPPLPAATQIKKRSRTAQACEKCRIRKAKCSGGQPCTRCINKKLPCVFSGTTRSRGAARWREAAAREAAEQAAKLRTRRHSLDDPFATPNNAPVIRDVRRHSEGSIEPRLQNNSALGLDLNPIDELARPASACQTWAPYTVPYLETVSAYPWTPDHRFSDGSYSYPTPLSAGNVVPLTYADWSGQPSDWHGQCSE